MDSSKLIANAERCLGDGLLAMFGKRMQLCVKSAVFSDNWKRITLRFAVEGYADLFVWHFNVDELTESSSNEDQTANRNP
jgi:hypothetical protein